jgi:protein-disulfide isomerase
MTILHRTTAALDLLSAIAVPVAAAFLIWSLATGRRAPKSTTGPVVAVVQEVSGLRIEAEKITNVLGHGPVAIVEFTDFQCPYCAAYAQQTYPIVRDTLVKPGGVQYVVLNFPLEAIHPLALKAGEAAECVARQGKFWEMHDRLFGEPSALDPTALGVHAKALGVDSDGFEQCLKDGEVLKQVRADEAEGRRLGVRATPSFFFGTVSKDGSIALAGRLVGGASAEVFKTEIGKLQRLESARID